VVVVVEGGGKRDTTASGVGWERGDEGMRGRGGGGTRGREDEGTRGRGDEGTGVGGSPAPRTRLEGEVHEGAGAKVLGVKVLGKGAHGD
jgi:hypothetical protein